MGPTKDLAKQSIHATLGSVKQFLAQEAPPKLSEADTKANFIEPMVSVLGWTGIGVVVREYYVKNSQEFIDYVMSDTAKPLLAIEAKALQADLTEKAGAQLVQYCVVEGIEWAALTNGRDLRFFNTYLKGDLAAKLVLSLDLLAFNSDAEYDALFEQLWLLSRDSMTTPAGVRTWLEHRRMDQALRAVVFNPASATIRSLRKYLADNDVKAGPEDIVQWFRGQLVPNLTPLPPITNVRTVKEAPVPYKSAGMGPKVVPARESDTARSYYLFPASKWGQLDALEHVRLWLDRGFWGMGESTPGRKRLKAGDRVCFYVVGVGVAATATVMGQATAHLADDEIPTGPADHVIYRVPFGDIEWLPNPIVIDAAVRSRLDAFKGKSVTGMWAWLVQSTCRLSEHDFGVLTGEIPATSQTSTG